MVAAEKEAIMGKSQKVQLEVSVPSVFRCPISLEVMRSPVSLCTGVTYDRSSIQPWLDAGHTTCPATMLPLPTTDLVPNHTLRRLIHLWSIPSRSPNHHDLLRALHSSDDPLPLLRKLAEVAGDASRVRELAGNADCVPSVAGVLLREGLGLEEMELAARVLSPVLLARKEDAGAGGDDVSSLRNPRAVSSLLAVLKGGTLESRVAAAWVLESIASSGAESKLLVAETEGLLPELLRLLVDGGEGEDPALACLAAVSSHRRVRPRLARLGAVPALGGLLARQSTAAGVAERALRVMEAAAGCPEGRAAICEDAAVVGAVVGRVMWGTAAATESAVAVLWSVCRLFRDRRAEEAVAASNGLTRVLLLMQSNCSPAAREMAGDLLKIFRVSSKGCLPGFDFNPTHIMPF